MAKTAGEERDGLEGGWREWGMEGWTEGWLKRVGDGGMLDGGWREDEGSGDFREWLERVRDGGILENGWIELGME